jgi:esterase
MDLPDHGNSPRTQNFSFDEYANLVVESAFKFGFSSFYLLGHSLGGKVAMQVAHNNTEIVKKLVVLDIAPVTYPAHHQTIISELNAIELTEVQTRQQVDHQLSRAIPEIGVRQFLLKSLYQNENNHWRWRFNLQLLTRDYEKMCQVPQLTSGNHLPTLFVKGGQSNYIRAEHQLEIVHYFSNAEMTVVEEAGHWLHAEQPSQVTQIVNDFLVQ